MTLRKIVSSLLFGAALLCGVLVLLRIQVGPEAFQLFIQIFREDLQAGRSGIIIGSIFLVLLIVIVAAVFKRVGAALEKDSNPSRKKWLRFAGALVPSILVLMIFGGMFQNLPNRIFGLLEPAHDIGSCFSSLRSPCMRRNCFSRHLVESQDSKLCETIEEEQIRRGIKADNTDFVHKIDCEHRFEILNSNQHVSTHYQAVNQTDITCPIDYGKIEPAAADINPQIARAGDDIEIKYRWQGGPSIVALDVSTLFQGTGFDDKGWSLSFFSENFTPPLSTLNWSQLTEFTRIIHLPKDLKAGSYSVSVSLVHPETKVPAELTTPSTGRVQTFTIGTLKIKDPTQPLFHSKEPNGFTPLAEAAYQGNVQKMELLFRDQKNKITTEELTRVLYYATGASPVVNQVFSGSTEAVRFLIDHGADVNRATLSGATPLMIAVSFRNFPSVQLLFERGAKLETRDQEGQTALSFAVSSQAPEIVQFLIDHGAQMDVKDKSGMTPLQKAIFKNDLSIIEILKKAQEKK